MKYYSTLTTLSLAVASTHAFSSHKLSATRPTFVAVRGTFDGADSLLDKLTSENFEPAVVADAVVPQVVAPPPPPVPEKVSEAVTEAASSIPVPELPSVELPSVELPSVELPSVELPSVELPSLELPSLELPSVELPAGLDGDLLPIVGGAVLVLAAVAALAAGGGGDEEAAAAAAVSAPAAAPVAAAAAAADTVDLSIPYDAAARLAYEKAGSPGDYETFKAKYEADAIAEVKAKQKK
ncbi:hypothetical protein ACA910_003333 [Epithemia clementina (nom. ined.)]